MTKLAARAPDALPSSPLARLRLLVALDALLEAGSVTGAARKLDISTPAMSRLLAQLRAQFDDPILVRTGQGMMPTPLARALRDRVHRLTLDADAVMNRDLSAPFAQPVTPARPPRDSDQPPPSACGAGH